MKARFSQYVYGGFSSLRINPASKPRREGCCGSIWGRVTRFPHPKGLHLQGRRGRRRSRTRQPGFRFWVTGVGFRASGCGLRMLGFGFRVSGSRLWVLGLGFRVPGFEFRVLSFGCRVSGFGFRVSGLGFLISGFGFRVPSFGFHVSCFALGFPRLMA